MLIKCFDASSQNSTRRRADTGRCSPWKDQLHFCFSPPSPLKTTRRCNAMMNQSMPLENPSCDRFDDSISDLGLGKTVVLPQGQMQSLWANLAANSTKFGPLPAATTESRRGSPSRVLSGFCFSMQRTHTSKAGRRPRFGHQTLSCMRCFGKIRVTTCWLRSTSHRIKCSQ